MNQRYSFATMPGNLGCGGAYTGRRRCRRFLRLDYPDRQPRRQRYHRRHRRDGRHIYADRAQRAPIFIGDAVAKVLNEFWIGLKVGLMEKLHAPAKYAIVARANGTGRQVSPPLLGFERGQLAINVF